MSKVEEYRGKLRSLPAAGWDEYLLQECGLPGPRGNLELAQAVATEGDEALFMRYLEYDAARAPTNSPYEFLAFCGVTGLGRLLASGERRLLPRLRLSACDPRWRTREGVAIALQTWGDRDMRALLDEMAGWSHGNRLEQRAAVAALCEPRLLRQPQHSRAVLELLDGITASLEAASDRRTEDFKTLRKALGYGWSVVVAAAPEQSRLHMQRWLESGDEDVRWVMRENLKKDRLRRMDSAWVRDALTALKRPSSRPLQPPTE